MENNHRTALKSFGKGQGKNKQYLQLFTSSPKLYLYSTERHLPDFKTSSRVLHHQPRIIPYC